MAKKSKAKIKRMIKRAEARGETYEPPVTEESTTTQGKDDMAGGDSNDNTGTTGSQVDQIKLKAAKKLEKELKSIEDNVEMKAKERRSAKRKAEAIAGETAGISAAELMEWYTAYMAKASAGSKNKNKSKGREADDKRKRDPYIAFVGQLSYGTTKDTLFKHIEESLGEEFKVTEETVKIRLLTDAKTGKSRGMAFVEVTNPELLYALLRLHQTFLDGRRINVERSAGGKASSETKKQKLEQFRKEQEEYVSEVVDKMLQDFYEQGTIQPDELDEGVISLFKRHSAHVVQAALERYVETNGKQKDNPNAYLTCLVGKIAAEGIFEKASSSNDEKNKRGLHDQPPPRKKPRNESSSRSESVLETEGVDMHAVKSTKGDLAKIFPSYNRGRGRAGKV